MGQVACQVGSGGMGCGRWGAMWLGVILASLVVGACRREVCPAGRVERAGRCELPAEADLSAGQDGDGGRGAESAPADTKTLGGCAQGCPVNAQCVWRDQGASCECASGYWPAADACVPDECQPDEDGLSPCGVHSLCEDPSAAEGDWRCGCEQGYARCEEGPGMGPGCPVALSSSAQHCGRCGTVCATGLPCEEGACRQWAGAMALGLYGTCLLLNESQGSYQVHCAGDDRVGLLGGVQVDLQPALQPVAGLSRLRSLVVGSQHACGVVAAGNRVLCWGSNRDLQLGAEDAGLPLGSSVWTEFEQGVLQVAVGGRHTCVLDQAGQVYCWGSNLQGRLGQPAAMEQSAQPVQVEGLGPVAEVQAAGPYTCVREVGGAVRCWGVLSGTTELHWGEPRLVQLSSEPLHAAQIALASLPQNSGAVDGLGSRACARGYEGDVYCWGAPILTVTSGESDKDPAQNEQPWQVPLTGAQDIAVALGQACALTAGTVLCWGAELIPPIAGPFDTEPQPVLWPTGEPLQEVVDVAMGPLHACVRLRSGEVACWGDNGSGQLADGTTEARGTPERLPLTGSDEVAP